MMEGTEHGRNRKIHDLKSKSVKLCGPSFSRLSSPDREMLCEVSRALGVFCVFSVCDQDYMVGYWRLSSFRGSPPLSPPPSEAHPGGAFGNCSSQSHVHQAQCF